MPYALIIDDDLFSAEVLERLLLVQGIASTTVTEATLVVRALHPDVMLVFLDLEMPKMNGYELLALLKQHLGSSVPIVACTAHVNEANAAWEQGFHSFIGKPLNHELFPSQLARILKNETVWEA